MRKRTKQIKTRITNAIVASVAIASLGACQKIPLRSEQGSVSHGSLHWFTNEKTAFLFFAVSETPDRLVDPIYEFSWKEQSADGGTISHDLAELDLSQAVHEHHLVNCAPNKVCGSYSFHAENPIVSGHFRFRYDRSSPLALEQDLDALNHPAGTTVDAYSAVLYGVFDKDNGHTQIRVHHNFGTPESNQVASYGLVRRFRVSDPILMDPDDQTIADHRDAVASPLMFPASFCQNVPEASLIMDKEQQWMKQDLDPSALGRGACFNARFLDRNSQPVLDADVSGWAFRNPDVQDSSLTFTTPLRPVTEIPVFVKICDDEPAAGGMIDQNFLSYQKFILGMPDRTEDLCFRIGQETLFRQEFQTHIANRLVASKTDNANGSDFMFFVLLHEKFSSEFLEVQGIIADELTTIVKTEETYASPRLVGAFIYSGSTNFSPTAAQRKYITWCPQELLAGLFDPLLGSQNCTTTKARDFDLQVINFVQPLGAFPSLANYTDYLKKYGDTGIAKNPDLTFSSPALNENSQIETGSNITFFDNERFSLSDGEYAKVCAERLDPESLSFFVRTPDQPGSVPSISLLDMNTTWLSDDATGSYRIGIQWDYPYWGGVSYTSAVSGKVISVIPYQQSFRTFENLADPKWKTDRWNFGKYVQKCAKYCDNPVFDEAGVFQPSSGWRTASDDRCQVPAPPTYDGAGL